MKKKYARLNTRNIVKPIPFLMLMLVLFSSTLSAQTLISVSPNKGQIGQQLNLFIVGQNTNFTNGSSSIQTTFRQGGTSITAPPVAVNMAGTQLQVSLDLSNTSYPTGFYDLSMNTPAHGILTLNNAFEIDTTALIKTIPNEAFIGQNITVMLVGQFVNFSSSTIAPIYVGIGGGDTIQTTVVQNRGSDTLELTLNLSTGTFLEGHYDLHLSTSGGTLFLRNALNLKTTTISGIVYYDVNSNVMHDPSEVGIGEVQLQLLPTGTFALTNNLGKYNFSGLTAGTYQVVVSPSASTFSTNPSDTQTVVVNSSNAFTANFGINTSNPSAFDSVSVITYARRVRCNVSASYVIRVRNEGLFANRAGVVYFVKDPALSYQSRSVTLADSVSGDTIYFSFSGLSAQQRRYISVYCDVPSISILPVGASVVGTSYAYRIDSMNNVVAGSLVNHPDSEIVRCSYDPNDKLVKPAGIGPLGYIAPDSQLEYTIRFQNTGNDTAYKVVIIDTLSNLLDYSTFQYIDASHTAVGNLSPQGELKFIFDNIYLVDSTTNEPESNGYVRFRINPVAGLPDSTTVSNRAGIYFDFNPPVITNYTNSTFASFVTSINEVKNGINAKFYPNPTTGQLRINLEKEITNASLIVFDIKGNRVFSQENLSKTKAINLDLSNYSDGIYLVRIKDGDSFFSKKVMLKR